MTSAGRPLLDPEPSSWCLSRRVASTQPAVPSSSLTDCEEALAILTWLHRTQGEAERGSGTGVGLWVDSHHGLQDRVHFQLRLSLTAEGHVGTGLSPRIQGLQTPPPPPPPGRRSAWACSDCPAGGTARLQLGMEVWQELCPPQQGLEGQQPHLLSGRVACPQPGSSPATSGLSGQGTPPRQQGTHLLPPELPSFQALKSQPWSSLCHLLPL